MPGTQTAFNWVAIVDIVNSIHTRILVLYLAGSQTNARESRGQETQWYTGFETKLPSCNMNCWSRMSKVRDRTYVLIERLILANPTEASPARELNVYKAWQLISLYIWEISIGTAVDGEFLTSSCQVQQRWNVMSNWLVVKIFPLTSQSWRRVKDNGWQGRRSVLEILASWGHLEWIAFTIGQRNFFLPEIKSQSKSRDINHSYLW